MRTGILLTPAAVALLVSLPYILADQPKPAVAVKATPSNSVTFAKDVLPVLQVKCIRCHGEEKKRGRLDLRSPAGLAKGGDSGPAVTPGPATASLLWNKIVTQEMPPGKEKLSAGEMEVVRTWIESGAREALSLDSPVTSSAIKQVVAERAPTAKDREFWSFQPPVRPAVPSMRHSQLVRNPVDAFILAALEKQGLTLSPECEHTALIRRATFDLTGLPPTPQEIDAYLSDQAADAYEKLIDRLLASPRYGECWARHWLDVAGYADSEGLIEPDTDRKAAWRYRDYVIESFNKDKPYDRFVQEQLAGDELVDYWRISRSPDDLSPGIVESLVATGFLRCAADSSLPGFPNKVGQYYQTLDDTVKITTSAILGLTVECARCHDHKYDPIPQSDYYRVQAIFMSAYRPDQWVPQPQRRLLLANAPGQRLERERADAAIAVQERRAEELKKEFAGYLFTGRLAKLPAAIREDVRVALTARPAGRTEVQKYLAAKFESELRPDSATLDRVLPEIFVTYRARLKEIEDTIKTEKQRRGLSPEIRALYDLPGEPKTFVLRRGDYQDPGPEVQPGVVSVVTTQKAFDWTPPAKEIRSSGRRLAFVRWLTQPDHPLTARVMVNRLWLHHFGEGLVSTPGNFGKEGARPTNPELLDWLATEFVRQGWSIKAVHRLIMTSSTYRQASCPDPAMEARAHQVDPENRLLWRQRLRRLDAEMLRDSVLAASGRLNPEMSGPPVPVVRQPDGEVTLADNPSGRRRSIYLQIKRSEPVTLLQIFDQPSMETNCTRRYISTASSQALFLLNGDFLVQEAEAFAARVLREDSADPGRLAFQIAFGRVPRQKELQGIATFLEEQARIYTKQAPEKSAAGSPDRRAFADLCHMLLSSNEFSYID
jgi:hypothetical protein